MVEQLISELKYLLSKLFSLLGWEGIELTWVHWLLLVLALVGALVVVRNLIGGRSGGGGGGSSTVVYPQGERPKGLPTSFYTGSSKLSDFSVPRETYNFKVPTPTPNLSGLRGPASVDMDAARRLFMVKLVGPQTGDIDSQSKDDTGHNVPQSAGPNWELAKKLFTIGRKF